MEQAHSPYAELPLPALAPSPTNPRKQFADLEDLAASISAQGVMQPILVRPWPDEYPTPEGRAERPLYEIIAGERRYRAALLAELTSIPTLCRPLTTRQVLEAQIVENLQRRDVTELEEAEGYQLMMRDHGYTADALAEKVGKSRAYIYARLKLCDMTEAPREAFRAGQIKASVALLIARLPTADLQARATACIVAADMSAREAAKHLQENNYMLQLERASWPLDEAFAGLPACLGCAHNSSTDREQHADISPDVCTDQECFAGKRSAHLLRQAEQLSAQGQRVLIGTEARNVAPSGTAIYIHNGYIPVARKDWLQGKHQTVTGAYGDRLSTVPHTWIEDVRTGELVECVGRESLWELDRAAAADEPPAVVAEREQRQAERAEKEQRIEQENEVREEIVGRIRAACRVAEIDQRSALMTIARHLLFDLDWLDEDTAKHYAPDAPEGDQEQAIAAMHTWLNTAPPARILGLLIEAGVLDSSTWRAAYWSEESHEMPEGLANLAALYGIDIDRVRAEVQGGQPAPTAAEAAPKTAPTPTQAAPAAETSAPKFEVGQRARIKAGACWENGAPIGSDNALVVIRIAVSDGYNVMLADGSLRTYIPAYALELAPPEEAPEMLPTANQAAPAAETSAPEKPLTGLAVAAEVSARVKNPVTYRHPDNGQTWNGRGRKPAWVEAWLSEGRTLTELTSTPSPDPAESAETAPTPMQAAPAAATTPATPSPAEPARAKKAAPASGKPAAGKGKKEAAKAAKKPKEKAKDSGRASPAKRKGKTTETSSAGEEAERDTRTIDMIAEAFPELGGSGTAAQGQQEARP